MGVSGTVLVAAGGLATVVVGMYVCDVRESLKCAEKYGTKAQKTLARFRMGAAIAALAFLVFSLGTTFLALGMENVPRHPALELTRSAGALAFASILFLNLSGKRRARRMWLEETNGVGDEEGHDKGRARKVSRLVEGTQH